MKSMKSFVLIGLIVGALAACEATTSSQFTSSVTPDVTEARSDSLLYAFVQQNRNQLIEEAAQGQGGTLGAVAQVLGCSGDQKMQFISTIQRQHSEIFDPLSDAEISKNLLSHRCF